MLRPPTAPLRRRPRRGQSRLCPRRPRHGRSRRPRSRSRPHRPHARRWPRRRARPQPRPRGRRRNPGARHRRPRIGGTGWRTSKGCACAFTRWFESSSRPRRSDGARFAPRSTDSPGPQESGRPRRLALRTCSCRGCSSSFRNRISGQSALWPAGGWTSGSRPPEHQWESRGRATSRAASASSSRT